MNPTSCPGVIMGLDPGLQSTGWAIFQKGDRACSGQAWLMDLKGYVLKDSGRIRAPKSEKPKKSPAILGIVEKKTMLQSDVVSSQDYRNDRVAHSQKSLSSKNVGDLALRLNFLWESLQGVMRQHRPNLMVIEKIFIKPQHPSAGMLLGYARAIPLILACRENMEIIEVAPTALKKTLTGYGAAQKQDMMENVKKLFGISLPHDIADAVSLGLWGVWHRG